MEKLENQFCFQTDKGQFYRHWKASSNHVLIYLHGVRSHSGWFNFCAREFTEKGISIYAPDRRGSGHSPYPKGDIEDFHVLIEDVKDFIRFVCEREKGKQIHLVGLCWGARLAVPVCLDQSLNIASLILIAPGLYPSVDYSFFTKIQILLAALFSPKKKFNLPLKDEYFTQTPFFLDFIQKDPYALRKVTARFLVETVKLNLLARKSMGKIKLPVLIQMGEKDKIVNRAKTSKLFFQIENQLKWYKFYPDWEHTLEFEKDNQTYYDDIEKWLNQVEKIK